MKFVSGSLLITLASTAAIAAAPQQPISPAPAAAAQTASVEPSAERLELARRYVALGNSDDFMQEMRAVMMHSASASASAEDQATVERFFDRVFVLAAPKIRERMPMLTEASAQAYAREFSAAELKDMIAFAETPTGKHYLARGAAVETDPGILKAQMEIMEGLGPIMEQVGTDMAKEACAKKAAARVAAGDKKATCPLAKAAETRTG